MINPATHLQDAQDLTGMLVTMNLTAQTWSSSPSSASFNCPAGTVRRRRARGSVLSALTAIFTRRTTV